MNKNYSNPELLPRDFIPEERETTVFFTIEKGVDGKVSFSPAKSDYSSGIIGTETDSGRPIMKDFTVSLLKGVGLCVPITAVIIGATVWVTSTIDAKSSANRLEMKSDLILVKQELQLQNSKIQDDLQRLSDRSDVKLDKLSDQLKDLSYSLKDKSK